MFFLSLTSIFSETTDVELGPEGVSELERLKNLIADMTSTHGELQGQLKQEMDREIHRLREFGTAMRNQLNLLQRQSVVGARTASRKILGMSGNIGISFEKKKWLDYRIVYYEITF